MLKWGFLVALRRETQCRVDPPCDVNSASASPGKIKQLRLQGPSQPLHVPPFSLSPFPRKRYRRTRASVDANVRGILIGSTWRRYSASLAVNESSLAVADYFLGQCDNFLQFAGQKDGATRCAQIVQLLLANHVDHDVSDPLVAVQLDRLGPYETLVF